MGDDVGAGLSSSIVSSLIRNSLIWSEVHNNSDNLENIGVEVGVGTGSLTLSLSDFFRLTIRTFFLGGVGVGVGCGVGCGSGVGVGAGFSSRFINHFLKPFDFDILNDDPSFSIATFITWRCCSVNDAMYSFTKLLLVVVVIMMR